MILEETLLKKGFFQAIFPKLLKVLGNREPLWQWFKGKTLFQKGFPLKLMTLPCKQWGKRFPCEQNVGGRRKRVPNSHSISISGGGVGFLGTTMLNSLPSLTLLFTRILPPYICIRLREVGSPKPLPLGSVSLSLRCW
jgi:hypothetical protein